jgi:hypothetical protein
MMANEVLIKVEFEGEFWAFEISDMINAFDELYADIALLEIIGDLSGRIESDSVNDFLIKTRIRQLVSMTLDNAIRSADFLRQDEFLIEKENGIECIEPLQILSMKYGSDGEFDFLGLGKIAEAFASVVDSWLGFAGDKAKRQEEALKVIDQKVEIARKAGYSEGELKSYRSELLAKHDPTFRKFIEDKRLKNRPKLLPAPKTARNRKPPSKYHL